ncbi:hypothetical protein [Antarctobacter heliothermus]|uniref:Uncharacterized protein n=1 Tax=Antarctobacter heliothermus TaxID=74033 RepID=A0A239IZD4_9RHOB|nr:hypothetical protein [Antarctobacter heliothermus]SNS97774.1 hypothetical protein SAMN04488078_104633 [Antarctobacter heliothermus]
MNSMTRLRAWPQILPGLEWIRKAAHALDNRNTDRHMRQHLARLVETAPHLLEDAGLCRSGTAERTTSVWLGRGLRVTRRSALQGAPRITVETGR